MNIFSKSDYKLKRCFICGELNADSKDHVPPKNIFLPETRSDGDDLIKIPSHTKCNQKYSKDDEYFRIFVNVPGFWNNKNAQELWNSKIFTSLQRPEAQKFKKSILSALKPVELFSESGIYLGKSAEMYFDTNRVERVIERIARGIYYKETEYILPLNTIIEISFIKPKESQNISMLNMLSPIKSYANDSFSYRWKITEDNVHSGVFWFMFYDSVEFVVLFFDKMEWDKRNA